MATTKIGKASKELFINTFLFLSTMCGLIGGILFLAAIIAIFMIGFLAQLLGPMVP